MSYQREKNKKRACAPSMAFVLSYDIAREAVTAP